MSVYGRDRPATHQWICWTEENRTEFSLRISKSEAEVKEKTADNRRLRSTYCRLLLKLTTDRHEALRGLCDSSAYLLNTILCTKYSEFLPNLISNNCCLCSVAPLFYIKICMTHYASFRSVWTPLHCQRCDVERLSSDGTRRCKTGWNKTTTNSWSSCRSVVALVWLHILFVKTPLATAIISAMLPS